MAVAIRRYETPDLHAVCAIHAAAFRREDDPDATPVEVTLVERLVARGEAVPELSLVAIDDDGGPVGHVVCSWATVGARAVVGLGPIGVLPERQRGGIGSRLMQDVLVEADRLGFPLVGLLGSPTFYGRFGFVPAATLGIEPPDPGWGEHFQVRPLSRYDARIRGPFRYAGAFDEVGAT